MQLKISAHVLNRTLGIPESQASTAVEGGLSDNFNRNHALIID